MRTIFHVKRTVHRIGRQLEQLSSNHIPVQRAFELLSKKARSVEELVVIEVMREVYEEMDARGQSYEAGSSARSARMPAMALSR